MESTCASIMKFLTFIFNAIIFFFGVAIVIFGGVLMSRMEGFNGALQWSNASLIILIAVGIFILIFGFFGCCGAYAENACMMYTYSTILFFLIVFEVAIIVAVFLNRQKMREEVIVNLGKTIGLYGQDAKATKSWDTLQMEMKCCGVQTFADWKNTNFSKGTNVPDSCCKQVVQGCGQGVLATNKTEILSSPEGCFISTERFLKEKMLIVAIIVLLVLLVQFVGMCITCSLARNMKRQSYV